MRVKKESLIQPHDIEAIQNARTSLVKYWKAEKDIIIKSVVGDQLKKLTYALISIEAAYNDA